MITKDTIQIERKSEDMGTIYLAPFGESELGDVSPLDTTGLNFPVSSAAAYARMSPRQLALNAANSDMSLNWGIYLDRVSVTDFLGIVSITQTLHDTDRGQECTSLMQEIGTYLMRPSARGQGIGRVAKAGLIAHAMEYANTETVHAQTSANNSASKTSLDKIGFSCLDTGTHLDFADGAKTELWYLAAPQAQEAISKNSSEQERLEKGWARYQEFLQKLVITYA